MKTRGQTGSHLKTWIWLNALLLCGGWSGSLFADDASVGYRFELTPYLWAASISGTAAGDDDSGGEPPPIEPGYSFFSLDNLDGVASTTFTVRKKQWGLLFDFLHVAFEDTVLEGTPLEARPRLEGRIVELAGAYALKSSKTLEVIAGLRNQDIAVSLQGFDSQAQGSANWTDPFVGVIYTRPLKGRFHMALRGDIGGFGIESDRAVNAQAMFRYQMGDTFSVKFGYRYLKVTFEGSEFIYDIGLDGILIGLGIKF